MAIDATKVVKVHEFSTAFSTALGGAAPRHIVAVHASDNSDDWMLPEEQLADDGTELPSERHPIQSDSSFAANYKW